jgi:TfoX/Sxy family transcriptional regulator of competence genes
MPARPLSDQTLHLIHALRESLEQALEGKTLGLQERTLFGSYCFFVDEKLCMGIKDDELLVRLPPERHAEFLEMQGLRELSPQGGMVGYFWIAPDGYASREHWDLWVREAVAYNPSAKASPRKKKAASSKIDSNSRAPVKGKSTKKHPIFGSE